jgi:hypothetical protein
MEYIKQRQLTLELNQEAEKHQNAEEAWYRQQQLLLDAEEKRRRMIQDEEQKLMDQRSRYKPSLSINFVGKLPSVLVETCG